MGWCFCKRTISYYVDGFLPEGKRVKVERHLKACGKCRAEAEANKALKRLPALSAVAMPEEKYWEDFFPRLEKHLLERETVQSRGIFSENLSGTALIFTLLMAFAGLLFQTKLVETIIRGLGITRWGKAFLPQLRLPEFWLAFMLVMLSSALVLVISIPSFLRKKEQLIFRPTH